MTEVPKGMIGCRCGATWGGTNTAHCSGCHLTFSGITAFDKHRVPATEGPKRPQGGCHDPRTFTNEDGRLVFELTDRKYECWTIAGKPAPEEES